MKQIIQDLKTGETILADVPAPQVRTGCVLIRTTRSLVSAGTEKMLWEIVVPVERSHLPEIGTGNLYRKQCKNDLETC